MFNLAINLESAAAQFPDREALVFRDRRITYREMDEEANRVANGLMATGIGQGDHVALVCPNVPEFVSCYFGILKVGAVVVCVSALLRGREIEYQLEHSDAVAMIAYGGADMTIGREALDAFGAVEACRHAWFIMPDDLPGASRTYDDLVAGEERVFLSALTAIEDTAVILYTSGTTGRPKGAELSHANIVMNVMVIARTRRIDPESEKTLIALPLFHVMAQTTVPCTLPSTTP